MALATYQNQVQSLLDDFNAVEYTTQNLTKYINDARQQIAVSSESIRSECTLTLSSGINTYSYKDATGFETGISQMFVVRMARIRGTTGYDALEIRPWEWFNSFYLSAPVIPIGRPTICASLRQGAQGILYFSPIPDATYTVLINATCIPVNLVDDNTPEVLTGPWFDAVRYFAAYLALLNAQRNADANAMYQLYKEFEMRGTQTATPTRLPGVGIGGAGARIAGQHMPITAPAPTATRGR